MLGFRRAAIHFALVALLLRAFLPAGWMPGAAGEAPLVMCSVTPAHDPSDGKAPVKHDSGTDGSCAFAASPALSPPDNPILAAPVLFVSYRNDEAAAPVSVSSTGRTRPAPRAPPTLL